MTTWHVCTSTPSLIEDAEGNTVAQSHELPLPNLSARARRHEMWARARVIAAAPDLLAAGEALYAAIGKLEQGEIPLRNAAILEAGKAWCAAFKQASV